MGAKKAACAALVAALLLAAACASFSSSSDVGADAGTADAPAPPADANAPDDGGCAGASCSAVVTGESGVSLVAVIGTDIYWAIDAQGSYAIRTCSLPSCVPVDVARLADAPVGLAVSAVEVLWAAGSAIQRSSRTAPFMVKGVTSSFGAVHAMTRSGQLVYFTAGTTISDCSYDIPSCGGGHMFPDPPGPVAIGTAPVVWTATAGGTIVTVDVPSFTVAAHVVSDAGSVRAFALGETELYWASAGSPSGLYAIPTTTTDAGPPPAPLLGDLDEPWDLALDVGAIYVSEYGAGTVRSVPLGDASAPTTLASGLDHPKGLALAADAVYVAESGAGRILRLAR